MKYLYPYECEKRGLSNPNELQAAIDSNRREGRRQGFGSSLFTYSPGGTHGLLSSPKLPVPALGLASATNGGSIAPVQKIKKGKAPSTPKRAEPSTGGRHASGTPWLHSGPLPKPQITWGSLGGTAAPGLVLGRDGDPGAHCTESQNGVGWKGPLKIKSSPLSNSPRCIRQPRAHPVPQALLRSAALHPSSRPQPPQCSGLGSPCPCPYWGRGAGLLVHTWRGCGGAPWQRPGAGDAADTAPCP